MKKLKHVMQGIPDITDTMCRRSSENLNAGLDIYHQLPPIECKGEEIIKFTNGKLNVDEVVLADQEITMCVYQAIERKSDKEIIYSDLLVRTDEPFEVKINHDFFRVFCYFDDKDELDHDLPISRHQRSLKDDNSKHVLDEQNNAESSLQGKSRIQADVEQGVMQQHILDANFQKISRKFENDQQGKSIHQNKEENHLLQTIDKDSEKAVAKENPDPRRPVDKEMDNLREVDLPHFTEKFQAIQDAPDSHIWKESEAGYDHEQQTFSLGKNNEPLTVPDFEQFFAQVHLKDEVYERIKDIKQEKFTTNILIFMFSSMSATTFKTKMPKTYSYIHNVDGLGGVRMEGYNIIGDSDVAQLVALLTGNFNLLFCVSSLLKCYRGRMLLI